MKLTGSLMKSEFWWRANLLFEVIQLFDVNKREVGIYQEIIRYRLQSDLLPTVFEWPYHSLLPEPASPSFFPQPKARFLVQPGWTFFHYSFWRPNLLHKSKFYWSNSVFQKYKIPFPNKPIPDQFRHELAGRNFSKHRVPSSVLESGALARQSHFLPTASKLRRSHGAPRYWSN